MGSGTESFLTDFERNAVEIVCDYMENISIWSEFLAAQMDVKLYVRENLGICGVFSFNETIEN